MSDNAPQPGAGEEVQKPDEVIDEPKVFDEAYVKKLRDEAASYRVKLKEMEDRDKSEAEKQTEKFAELQREVEQFRQRDQVAEWAQEIVKDSHITADVLRGTTKEELTEHFNQLSRIIPQPKKPVPNTWDRPEPGSTTDVEFVSQLFGTKN